MMVKCHGILALLKTKLLSLYILFVLPIFLILIGISRQVLPHNLLESQAQFLAKDYKLVNKKLPYLSRLTLSVPEVHEVLVEYATSILKPRWIKTEDDLLSIFPRKDQLIHLLSQKLSEPLINSAFDWMFANKKGDWEYYMKELEMIGIKPFFAEGMLAGFADFPFLQDVVSRVASEPCRLYIEMKNAFAESYGLEYTYYDLKPEMKTIAIGEKLLQSFPESKYVKLSEEMLYKALYPLTDIHVANLPGLGHLVIVGDLFMEPFPWDTDINEHQEFLKKYPQSRFRDVILKILSNISEITSPGKVYAVVVEEYKAEKEAQQAVLYYLLNRLDIPHILTNVEKDLTTYAVVYRFYSDLEKAAGALKIIQKVKPQAEIKIFHARRIMAP